jgi:Uma2 family endonuclease
LTQQEKLYAITDFEGFIAQPDNRDRRFELIDGGIVEKPMPTKEHGVIAGNTVTHINIHRISIT